MKPSTQHEIVHSRSERHSKRKKPKRLKKMLWIIIFILFILAGSTAGFMYGTPQGLSFRKMLVGSVLSTQHARYVKYMTFLLPQNEIDALKKLAKHPPTKQTTINQKTLPLDYKKKKQNQAIKVDTIETQNYTAKVLIIPDPTTVHLVPSQLKDQGQGLSDIIKENNGVAGINAGGFVDKGGTGSGGQVIGIVISEGKVLDVPSAGRDKAELVGAFLSDGQFITGNYSVNQLMKLGVTEAVSFGPQLIVDGKNQVTSSIDAAWGWAPRTAIGQAEDGKVVMIITDGRFYWNKTHRGASMSDMEHLMETYHVKNAISMDGGGSTTMINNGQLLLKPATQTSIGMRYLPNAWVVIPN
ncbi:phosphodiester glycosidase family protein [Pullulanibacillus sp. KACC 23026]|uniref:phosphodiester glycosidase family protein n=1 Tax=Pullulanibacillus sp. KACC 23026 TaxID=3028315 RepID=UPI0023B0AFFA|nr:phosphodiester glycosidase family protein [Pullulanibacillus sp. KACC 23026]WEG14800.1 phosphodiester glycosidase family protein [Pullulanibacillus sp. KACC 23026]